MRLTLAEFKKIKRKPRRVGGRAEDRLQTTCVEWFRLSPDTRWLRIFAVRNEGKRSPMEGARAKAMGMQPGIADLVVILPDRTVAFIEMKDEKGVQSETQIAFQKDCEALALPYYLCRSLEEFQVAVRSAIRAHTPKVLSDGIMRRQDHAMPVKPQPLTATA
jgi:hypothetical protein